MGGGACCDDGPVIPQGGISRLACTGDSRQQTAHNSHSHNLSVKRHSLRAFIPETHRPYCLAVTPLRSGRLEPCMPPADAAGARRACQSPLTHVRTCCHNPVAAKHPLHACLVGGLQQAWPNLEFACGSSGPVTRANRGWESQQAGQVRGLL